MKKIWSDKLKKVSLSTIEDKKNKYISEKNNNVYIRGRPYEVLSSLEQRNQVMT